MYNNNIPATYHVEFQDRIVVTEKYSPPVLHRKIPSVELSQLYYNMAAGLLFLLIVKNSLKKNT